MSDGTIQNPIWVALEGGSPISDGESGPAAISFTLARDEIVSVRVPEEYRHLFDDTPRDVMVQWVESEEYTGWEVVAVE